MQDTAKIIKTKPGKKNSFLRTIIKRINSFFKVADTRHLRHRKEIYDVICLLLNLVAPGRPISEPGYNHLPGGRDVTYGSQWRLIFYFVTMGFMQNKAMAQRNESQA